jgi:hypothetical protein
MGWATGKTEFDSQIRWRALCPPPPLDRHWVPLVKRLDVNFDLIVWRLVTEGGNLTLLEDDWLI